MKLKEMRESKGLSQSQLADMAGINFRTLQNYEQGTRNINKMNSIDLYKLSKVLGCKMEELLELEK